MTAAESRKTFAVVLSGCGVRDGSEIHEATLTLLALDMAGVEAKCFAPDIPQNLVACHLSGARGHAAGTRNVLEESARIARGRILPLDRFDAREVDALVFPGGNGAAVNLSDFAMAGAAMKVHPQVARAIEDMHRAGKPQGFVCIAPVLAACVLGRHSPRLTIGDDVGTAAAVKAMGAVHVPSSAESVVVDDANRLASTPAYMLAQRIGQVAEGVSELVKALVRMCDER